MPVRVLGVDQPNQVPLLASCGHPFRTTDSYPKCDLGWDREVTTMTAAHPRPDLAAYAKAARMSQPELVAALRTLLGAKLVAFLGRV